VRRADLFSNLASPPPSFSMATGRSRGINLDDLILRRRAPEPYGDNSGGGGSGGATGEGMRGSGGRGGGTSKRGALLTPQPSPNVVGKKKGGGRNDGGTSFGGVDGGRRISLVDNRRRIAPQPINGSGGDTLVRREVDEPQLQTEGRGTVASKSKVDVKAPASHSGDDDNNDGDDDDNDAFGGAEEVGGEDDDDGYDFAMVATGSDGAT